MKILELTELYPPDIGGTQRHVARQAEELARRGHTVTVLTHAVADADSREVTPDGITVLRVAAPILSKIPGYLHTPQQRYSPPAPEPKTLRLIRHLIRADRPDVVLAHNWIIYSYLAIKRASDPPVVWILHDYSGVCHKRNLMYTPIGSDVPQICPGPRLDRCVPCGQDQYGLPKSLLLATALSLASRVLHSKIDQVVAVSSAVSAASQRGFHQPVRTIPTFLADHLNDLALSQPRPPFCPSGDYIMFVGSFAKHKGVDVLLEAYQRLDNPIPLLILAARAPRDALRARRITVVSDVDHHQVMAAWAHCTLGVIPSIWEEPWGQVAAEAATVGKAVVATRVGGLKELVLDGETGLLVPPNDAEALRNAIQVLLSKPDLREAMGARAKEHVRPFTVSVVTNEIEKLLHELVP